MTLRIHMPQKIYWHFVPHELRVSRFSKPFPARRVTSAYVGFETLSTCLIQMDAPDSKEPSSGGHLVLEPSVILLN